MGKVRDLFKGISSIMFKDSQDGHALGTILVDDDGNFYNANTISNIGYVSGTTKGIDPYTQSLITVDFPHHEVHEGDHYHVKGFVTLQDTNTAVFTVVTPNSSEWANMKFTLMSTGETYFGVFEDGTISATGTLVTPVNNNRNSANTSNLLIYRDSTINASGTAISESLFGITSNPASSAGGSTGRDDEFILKQNTLYNYIIVSNSNSNNIDFIGYWYEHEANNA